MQRNLSHQEFDPAIRKEHLRIIDRVVPLVQEFDPRLIHFMKNISPEIASTPTLYRRLRALESINLAKLHRGKFEIKAGVIAQPIPVLKNLLPSLISLKKARRFGRSYGESDIKFAMDKIQNKLLTLDFAAWELTKFQTPKDLFIYVDNVEDTASFLQKNGFSEGEKGHIILLPKIGNFENLTERIYLDSIANGERSILDAIAIDLKYGGQLTVKGQFPIEYITKVQEDMPTNDQTQD